MTDEEWFRDTLERETRVPAGVQVDVDAVITRGRRRRRRRSVSVSAAAAVVLAAVIGIGAVIPNLTTGVAHPAGTADSTADGLHAPYWHASVTDQHDAYVHGVLVHEPPTTEEFWLGHDRPSVSRGTSLDPRSRRGLIAFSLGFAPNGPGSPSGDPNILHVSPAWNGDGRGNFAWPELWRMPTTAPALQRYFDVYERSVPGDTVFSWAASLLEDPGPDALHRGLADLIASLPGTVVTRGNDSLGRPAEILTVAAPYQPDATDGSDRVFIDPATGRLLQFEQLAGKPEYPRTDLPLGSILDRRVYLQLGPAKTAPAVTGHATISQH